MDYLQYQLANEVAATEAIRSRREYTVIGFTDFGLVAWIDGHCEIK